MRENRKMKILIICTWFPPDAGIAPVRPFMLARHLMGRGHDVTVLHSGLLSINRKVNREEKWKLGIYTPNGEEIPERIKGVEKVNVPVRKVNLNFLPSPIKRWLSKMYHIVCFPIEIYIIKKRFRIHKQLMSRISNKNFDLVFSTYGELENIYAGQYAANKFSCKLIQDFRDLVVNLQTSSKLVNFFMKPIEKKAVQKADLCITVAEATTEHMRKYATNTRCITLYNGYERSKYSENDISVRKNQFVICYTGSIYPEQRTAVIPLFQTIKSLIQQGKMSGKNVCFTYAGGKGDVWKRILKKMELDVIYEDYGYISRDETERLQRESDLYLVLSWNYANSQGVISGKFYEGIRAVKPILSVVGGDLPNSELYQMNEKYHYGYCFEEARGKDEIENLKQYLLNAYNQKMEIGKVDYQQNPALAEDFCYENLAKKLENLCYELIGEEQLDVN